ncbi:MAG: chorismate-binding protein [Parachlamydia sp.]|nr:chorismate-binding protein [Parachlamydia sp.]
MSKWGTLAIRNQEVICLPKLCHLKTPIELSLHQPFQFEAIAKHLHPTPALGVFPKIEGWAWLKKYDRGFNRKNFGAPVGYKHEGTSACFAGIRQVQWSLTGMRIGAGCGVVRESVCEREWDEIMLKINAVRKCLDL